MYIFLLFDELEFVVLKLQVLVELLEGLEDVVLVVAENGAMWTDHLLICDAYDLQQLLVFLTHAGLYPTDLAPEVRHWYL
jgi:hypothetical protein